MSSDFLGLKLKDNEPRKGRGNSQTIDLWTSLHAHTLIILSDSD